MTAMLMKQIQHTTLINHSTQYTELPTLSNLCSGGTATTNIKDTGHVPPNLM
jgi:hypothetical protein